MTADVDPIHVIYRSQGVPCVRHHHNKVKLLSHLSRTSLLDIGSGFGADPPKWLALRFKRLYAVDPHLALQPKHALVIPLRTTAEQMRSSFS